MHNWNYYAQKGELKEINHKKEIIRYGILQKRNVQRDRNNYNFLNISRFLLA